MPVGIRSRIIPLGAPLPARSSALTRTPATDCLAARSIAAGGPPLLRPYLSLLRKGFTSPPVARLSRVGSYPTISPLPPRRRPRASPEVGRVFSVALSLGSPPVAVGHLPALWSPDFPLPRRNESRDAARRPTAAILRPPPGLSVRTTPAQASRAPPRRGMRRTDPVWSAAPRPSRSSGLPARPRAGAATDHGVGFTGHGLASQISSAYSAMVRSLENLPDAATFRIALPVHACGSAYRSTSRASASR